MSFILYIIYIYISIWWERCQAPEWTGHQCSSENGAKTHGMQMHCMATSMKRLKLKQPMQRLFGFIPMVPDHLLDLGYVV